MKPNCEKAILSVHYPLGVTREYIHRSWNRWTAALWAMCKSNVDYPSLSSAKDALGEN